MVLRFLRTILTIVGLLLLALFVWFGGPFFAFGEYHPLGSELARIAVIALIVGWWAVSFLIKRLRALRLTERLMAGMVKQAKDESGRPSAEAGQLRERFEEAVSTLKHTKRGGRSLYDLPWYVIIGAPGSGKTTALLNSGLRFPLDRKGGRGALRGVGGTRNCEWLFTDDAVFLDTAGRYTTQDSDAAADGAAWKEFLALLCKYRKRRPVNGVILALSAHDLLLQGPDGREAHIAATRRRLDELNRELRIQLPVYLVVTKCDLIAGFTEYFDDLTQEGRAQVWGVTFPYKQSVRGDAAVSLVPELEALLTRLNERMLGLVEAEGDVARRARLFGFPQQMAMLVGPLSEFTSEVFASTRFDRQTLLRGVYFTSGTQEGTPIDRLIAGLGRRLAVAPEAVVASGGRGKAYFIERLLKEVMLGESGLAGTNRRLEWRYGAAQLGTYALLVAVGALGFLAMTVSYRHNRGYLQEVSAAVDRLPQMPALAAATAPETMLPRLDAVRSVADAANQYRDVRPWSMRWGLFQGASVGLMASDAYARELDRLLLPIVRSRIEQRLAAGGADVNRLYEYLKTYLMLGEPQHLDKNHLTFFADMEWKAEGASADVAASVSKHFRSLLDSEKRLRPLPLNASLVAQSRSTIQQASIPQLIYSRLKLARPEDPAKGFRLDVAAGVGADRVLKRKGGRSLSDPVPGLYTSAVFKEVTGAGAAGLVKEFGTEAWVWGDGGLSFADSNRLAASVNDIYERDYIAAWDAILNDIELVSFSQIGDALAILAAPTSPLRGLLQAVDANTHLVQPAQPAAADPGIVGTVKDKLGKIFAQGKEAAGVATTVPGSQVTAHFLPIHQLVTGPPGGAPIDRVLAQFAEIQRQLLSAGVGPGQTKPLDVVADAQLSGQLRQLQQDTATLPPVVRAWVGQVANRAQVVVTAGATSDLDQRYQTGVRRECRAVIEGKYPFSAGSAVDVPLDDFGRLFGYGGIFDAFFTANLEKLVDTSRSPWTWRPGSVGMSSAMLRQFEAAQRLRETFFRPGSQRPELRFTVATTDLDVAATRFLLEIDGQAFDYRHGPERNLAAVWPGPNPGQAAATFEDRAGRPNRAFEGPWAWFRLVDAARLQRQTDVRALLRFELGGHIASVRIEAGSVHHPLARRDWQQFRCAF